MKIIDYEGCYKDDLIFMILEAKDALGRIPSINPDLLDIPQNYLEKGACFWIAIDDNNRVIGSIAYSSLPQSQAVFLHRLFVKSSLKGHGIGSQLLVFAENHLKQIRKSSIKVHLGEPKEQWLASYHFYPKHGYQFYDDTHLVKHIT